MHKIKFLAFLLLLALTAACGQQKPAATGGAMPDNEENRLAAAKQYLEVAPPEDLLNDLTAGISQGIPEQARKTLDKVLAGKTIKEQAYQIALKAAVKQFTVNELKAMTAFYSTPEGKSLRKKQGLYHNEVITGLYMEVIKEFHELQPKPPEEPKPEGQKAPETGKMPPPPAPQPGPPVAKPGAPPAPAPRGAK